MDFDETAEKLRAINAVIEDLDEALKPRAIDVLLAASLGSTRAAPDTKGLEVEPGAREYENFAELYYEADPDGEAAKVLVAAFFQVLNDGAAEITAASVNKTLRNVGQDVKNPSRALLTNVAQKRVMRAGQRGHQALYRLTPLGDREVREMIAQSSHRR